MCVSNVPAQVIRDLSIQLVSLWPATDITEQCLLRSGPDDHITKEP